MNSSAIQSIFRYGGGSAAVLVVFLALRETGIEGESLGVGVACFAIVLALLALLERMMAANTKEREANQLSHEQERKEWVQERRENLAVIRDLTAALNDVMGFVSHDSTAARYRIPQGEEDA